MAYTDTWNAAFEGDPEDTDARSEGAERIRELKTAVRERFAKDHYMEIAGTDADHGEHVKVTLRTGAAPSYAADKGFLYAKDASSKAELHYLDEDNNEIQLTSGGLLKGNIQFPATQVPSANANVLDDYEEGTATLTAAAGTSGTITLATGYETIAYTKIGRLCTFSGRIIVVSTSSPVGTLRLNGLPFTVGNAEQYHASVSAMVYNLIGSPGPIMAGVWANATYIYFGEYVDGAFSNPADHVSAGTVFILSGQYIVA